MWIIILLNRKYVVGPFEWLIDAELYARDHMCLKEDQYETRNMQKPDLPKAK